MYRYICANQILPSIVWEFFTKVADYVFLFLMNFMKSIYYAILFLFLPGFMHAQKFNIKGILTDSTSAPLEGGTVMLMNPKDSALIGFTRTKAAGEFELKNISGGEYILRCTYLGFNNMSKRVTIGGAQKIIDIGTLKLGQNTTLLGEAIISGQANPIVVKGDTVVYNAESFKTKPNAVVEDLLKKLPGIEVDKDGTVTAHGKEVQNVLVEGKRFFGSDPKIATKNLPADAVNKVEVYDKKSDQATFSGVDDGQKEKTINLELKDDRKNGWFGKISAGAGADMGDSKTNRYTSKINLSRFTPKTQLSFLGQGNNNNEAGFSWQDYMSFSGAERSMMSGQGMKSISFSSDGDNAVPMNWGDNDGFIKTWSGGANYNNEFTKKTELNASYFYTKQDKEISQTIFTQNFVPTGNFNTDEASTRIGSNDNHRVNFTLDQKVDSFNNLKFTGVFGLAQSDGNSAAQTTNRAIDGLLRNDGVSSASSLSDVFNWSGEALYRHKFHKKGRNISTTVNMKMTDSDASGSSISENKYYAADGASVVQDSITQLENDSKTKTNRWSARTVYTEPLGKKRYLELSYGLYQTLNDADKNVYRILDNQRNFASDLSNAYTSNFTYHKAGVGYRLNKTSWEGSFGLDVQKSYLDGDLIDLGQTIKEDYLNFLPRLDFSYNFTQAKSLRFNYNSGVNPPTVQQLQPVADVSNPLSIYEGNPELNPEITHSVNINFHTYNPENGSNMWVGMYGNFSQDNIGESVTTDPVTFVRRTQPINTGLSISNNVNAGYGYRVKSIKTRFYVNGRAGLNQSNNEINAVENKTQTFSYGTNFNATFSPKDWFELSGNAGASWNNTQYSINKEQNQKYVNQNFGGDLYLEIPKFFNLSTDYDVTINGGRTNGFDATIPIWNASISRSFLKSKKLELTLAVNDILNKNIGLSRSQDVNYVREERINNLARYYMVSLTYSLNSMMRPGGGRGGMFRMMRMRH